MMINVRDKFLFLFIAFSEIFFICSGRELKIVTGH